MYVRRLGQIPSFVQPANPTPLNDPLLAQRPAPVTHYRPVDRWPTYQQQVWANYPQQSTQIQPMPIPTDVQPASVTATVTANPGGLTAWLQTGNNGIYAAIGVAVLLLLLTRRR